MSDSDRISASLDAAAITALTGAIQAIRTNLPFLIGFTPEERKMLPRTTRASASLAARERI